MGTSIMKRYVADSKKISMISFTGDKLPIGHILLICRDDYITFHAIGRCSVFFIYHNSEHNKSISTVLTQEHAATAVLSNAACLLAILEPPF